MATILKLLLFVVTVLMPGGLIVIPLYYLVRRRRAGQDLDFTDRFRRAPMIQRRQPISA